MIMVSTLSSPVKDNASCQFCSIGDRWFPVHKCAQAKCSIGNLWFPVHKCAQTENGHYENPRILNDSQ